MAFSGDNKHSSARVVRLVLMVSSIVLLLLFQAFWLASSYEQAYRGFQRETSAMFRSTVFSIRDSLFLSDLEHLLPHPDSARKYGLTKKVTVLRSETPEMGVRRDVMWEDNMSIAGSVSNQHDSSIRHKNYVIRIRADDTLSIVALRERFKSVIAQANYTTPFTIDHNIMPVRQFNEEPADPLNLPVIQEEGNGSIRRRSISIGFPRSNEQRFWRIASAFKDTLTTEQIPIGPIHAYAAVFPHMRSNIIRRIAPQLLFSVFLSALTAAAFIIMYRNLRSQERVVEMKNDFISNVTHELKTPIATVSVALEALKDFNALKNPAKTSEYLNIAQHELNRLSLMTDKILKASVFEQNGVSFVIGVVKVDDIVRQVTESLTVVLDKKRIKASIKLTGTHFEMEGSDMHLTNVVYNLLDNAIKYSPTDTSIDIELMESGDELILKILDQGIGIDPAHHKRIFEKFFRVPTGDVHNTRGYGLGLNYVANVVKSHGGNISVESAPDQGSSFTIYLPRKHGS
ncbi:HAMP domain-containing sensor histidine kinase [Chryseolinea sp. T2]|uniref:sensor histidine kinase n=1 Tax=Chryseolinea sp. T2 TaxID=3129255 RepID=UPI0030782886